MKLASVLLCLCISSAAGEAIPDWAREANAKWFHALQAGDAAALARLYTEDAVSVTPSRVLRGRAAIEAFHRSNFEKSRAKCTWNITGAQVLEKQAAVWGRDTCTETPTSGAKPWTSQTRWLTIYERQADGSWLVVRESYDLLKP